MLRTSRPEPLVVGEVAIIPDDMSEPVVVVGEVAVYADKLFNSGDVVGKVAVVQDKMVLLLQKVPLLLKQTKSNQKKERILTLLKY